MAKKTITPKLEVTEKLQTETYDIFTIVEKNKKSYIAIANKIISKEHFNTVEDAKKYIDSKPWELLINASCAVFDILKNDLKK